VKRIFGRKSIQVFVIENAFHRTDTATGPISCHFDSHDPGRIPGANCFELADSMSHRDALTDFGAHTIKEAA
jgi:hypothetical protein